jgi:RNA polymerase sigma factor (sigma-70 family)
MAAGGLAGVLRRFNRAAGPCADDGGLVQLFVARCDGAAFAELVRRHGPMVLGVCRRVLRDTHAAEDAFQATVLVLARKADAIRPRERVGPWLYGVAYRTALGARRAAARRRAHERPMPELPPTPVETAGVEPDLAPLLDRELNRLPEKLRAPVVLCDLEGRPWREAARLLNLPAATLSNRLTAARARLAARLTRLGLAPAVGLTTALATVPAPLLAATVRATAGAASTEVSTLAHGVIRAMMLTKLKPIMGVVVALAAIGAAAGLGIGPAGPAARARAPEPAAVAQDKKGEPPGPIVRGVVRTVDPGPNKVTVAVLRSPDAKDTDDRTFPMAAGAKVILEDALDKSQASPEGALGDLSPGTEVTLMLTPDGKSVRTLSARGPTLHAHVKWVAPAQNTLAVSTKDADGPVEKEVRLVRGAKIILDDGIGPKTATPPEGAFADLTEDTPVVVRLTVNREVALEVRVHGPTLHAQLKEYDAAKGTLTVIVKEDGQLVDRALTLAKEARLEGELAPGAGVNVRLAVRDRTIAVAVQVRKDE